MSMSGTTKETDWPDDQSDISTATAPPVLERTLKSPTYPSTPSSATGVTTASASASASAASSPAASLSSVPTSASSIFSKYATSFQQSDAAAALSKATTNSYIQALQWKEQAPSTLSKIREDVSQSLSGAAGMAKTVIRPPSPTNDPPFTPPTYHSHHQASYSVSGRLLTPDSAAYGGVGLGSGPSSLSMGERRSSSGPKPLLLGSGAGSRRGSSSMESPNVSPSLSRRTSFNGGRHTPSTSMSATLPGEHQGQARSMTARSPSPVQHLRGSVAGHGRAASAFSLGGVAPNGSPRTEAGTYKLHQNRMSVSNLNEYTASQARRESVDGSSHTPHVSSHIQHASPRQAARVPDGDHHTNYPHVNGQTNNTISEEGSTPDATLSRSTRAPTSSHSRPSRSKGLSSELEVLDDSVVSGTMRDATGPSTPTALISEYFARTNLADGHDASEPSQTSIPVTPPNNHDQLYDADDAPLSPTSSLTRHRKSRVSSLVIQDPSLDTIHDQQVSTANEEDVPLTPGRGGRRKLASSRRLGTRRDSLGSSASIDSGASSRPQSTVDV